MQLNNKSFEDLITVKTLEPTPQTGLADAQGWRPTMEDAWVVDALQGAAVLAVFDGHGGADVAAWGAGRLAKMLGPALAAGAASALAAVFPEMDGKLKATRSADTREGRC